MNKYVVKVSNVFSSIIEVDAEDEDMARVKAREFLENREENDRSPIRHYYESTFPIEHWPVLTIEDYEKLKAQVEENAKKSDGNDESVPSESSSNIITPPEFSNELPAR